MDRTGIPSANHIPMYTTRHQNQVQANSMAICLGTVVLVAVTQMIQAQDPAKSDDLAAVLVKISPHVAGEESREGLRNQVSRALREQIAAANRASSAEWA